MAAAAARVDDLDLFRGQIGILFADLGQLGLYLRLLLGFLQIIVPLGVLRVTVPGSISCLLLRCGQQLCFCVRVTLHPQASKAVFHHVPHDPVWGKQLGRRRDILLGDLDIFLEGGKHIVLFLAVVVLIQPANDLDGILPVVLRDLGDHLLNDAALPEQVVRQKQLSVVRNGLEHSGQNAVQRVALHDEQVFVQFFGLLGLFQGVDLVLIQLIQFQMQGFGQNLGLERIVFIRKHAHMAGQIAVDLHEPQCREAVEPCIRHLFHNLLVALFIDLCDQCPALLHLLRSQHPAVDAISTGVHHFRFRNAVLLGFLRHAGDQFFPRPDRIFLDGGFIHDGSPLKIQLFRNPRVLTVSCNLSTLFLNSSSSEMYTRNPL